ncbi:hypothetical protein [Streptomyces xylophagus]|uniref:hypothetical protein n=1 Tax=Streptomyces xylophagus TaxID=285514 RepID=UPI000AEFE816|nr:hypothetical protein [Streptomyces xylophagus]
MAGRDDDRTGARERVEPDPHRPSGVLTLGVLTDARDVLAALDLSGDLSAT